MPSMLTQAPQPASAESTRSAASAPQGGASRADVGIPSRWQESPRQLQQGTLMAQLRSAPAAEAPSRGGLPGGLRRGIESLSGMDMSGVRVHRNSSKPAALQAHAYAQGQDIHLGPGQEKHLPHEAWHVVQQAQGRVRATTQMKRGVPVNDDAGLEREADVMGARAMQLASSATLRPGQASGGAVQGRLASPRTPVQRWVQPGEDAAANRLKDQIDGIERSATQQRDRARDLSTAVPAVLRTNWVSAYINAYQTANGIRLAAIQAQAQAQPAQQTLLQVQQAVAGLGGQLNQVRTDLNNFANHYQGLSARIQAQVQRRASLTAVLADANGAGKQADWTALSTAIQTMNHGNMTLHLAAFEQEIGTGTFSAQDVAAARLAGAPAGRVSAVVEFLTDLFATGRLRLDTWSKTYPTSYDLKTGEFGAEWYLKCSSQNWLGSQWVFHAHCESIRDGSGNHTGFRFKNAPGCNHLKMQSERMALGVSINLPLPAGVLIAMAAPYQQTFQERYQDDANFRAALKKAR